MNSLLNAVSPIINSKTAKVTLDISAASTEGELMVIVKPVVGPVSDKAPEELKMLSAALAQPIKVVGEAQDIEDKLAEIIGEQAGKRNQWANRAAELDASIAAAAASDAKKDAGQKTGGANTTASKPASTVDTSDDTADSNDEQVSAGFEL